MIRYRGRQYREAADQQRDQEYRDQAVAVVTKMQDRFDELLQFKWERSSNSDREWVVDNFDQYRRMLTCR